MTVKDAINIFQISQKNIHRKRTKASYRYILGHLENHFADIHVKAITPDHIYQSLESLTEHLAKSTRRLRYAQLKAFFNEEPLPGFSHCQSFQKPKNKTEGHHQQRKC